MYISVERLQEVFPNTPVATLNKIIEPLVKTLQKYSIITPNRVAMFLAQVGHESGEWKFWEENLNYSEAALRKLTKYFTPEQAKQYARKPQAIANRIYANRMGNGPESSGDGWKHRGRGPMQVTGYNNYKSFAQHMGMSVDDAIKFLSTVEGGFEAAGWFWNRNRLNAFADRGDVKGATRIINGGYNGLDHRVALWNRARKVFV